MKKSLDQVTEFHVATQNPVAVIPGIPPHDRIKLRAKLLMEESMETVGAMLGIDPTETKEAIAQMNETIDAHEIESSNLVEVADGLADTVYVAVGAAIEFGVPLDKIFDEVHASNMSKIGGGHRSDGKSMKGPNFKPPAIGRILAENGWAN